MQDAKTVMKVNRLEAHDRLEHLIKDQSASIQQGCEDCLKKNPDSIFYQAHSPYIYIFGHPRTHEDGFTKRLLWQPRLTKPKAEPNSYLFRAVSNSDNVEVCWVLPPKEFWGQYKEKNIIDSDIVTWSIQMYLNNRKELEKPFGDDLPEHRCKEILLALARSIEEEKLKPNFSGASLIFS